MIHSFSCNRSVTREDVPRLCQDSFKTSRGDRLNGPARMGECQAASRKQRGCNLAGSTTMCRTRWRFQVEADLSQLNPAVAATATPAALLPLRRTIATISPTKRRRDPPPRGLSPPHETLLPCPPSKSARTAHLERTGTTFRTALEATGVYWKHFAVHRDDVNSI